MDRLIDRFFSRTTLLVFFGIAIILWLFGLYHRYIEADESILGEYSYYFLNEGTVRLKTIPEILTWDERMWSHHRFFTWYGAVILQLFGWSIYAFKTSIIPFYILFFYLLYRYFKLVEKPNSYFLLAAFLVFTSPIVWLKSFSFRPDVVLMAEGMAVLFFLMRYRKNNQWKDALLAGAFAGLGFLTHLNGLAFCMAGFFFLLVRKEFKALIPFVGAGAVVGGLYFIELLPPGNFDAFIYELTHWPTVNHGANYIGGGFLDIVLGRIEKLLSEHRRFFWGDHVISFSAFFFGALLVSFRKLKNEYSDALVYLLILVLALNIFGSHVAERYLLFYYGPMAVISSVGFNHVLENKNKWKLTFLCLLFILQVVFVGNMIKEIYQNSYDVVGEHEEVLSKIPNESYPKILLPLEMIYNGMPEYNLYSFKTYEYLQESLEGKMTQQLLFKKANELGMQYIVINKRLAEYSDSWFYLWNIEQNPWYNEMFRNDRYVILERTADN